MKRENRRDLLAALCMLGAFALWTAAVCTVEVKPAGPLGSVVGFASINSLFHSFTDVHMWLYTVTDWMGLVPAGIAIGFGMLGLIQWIKRKNLLKVDKSILVLGAFYIVVAAAYILFEMFPINYRPVLINGYLEASYPSSTTLLALCVMPTAVMQLNFRIKNEKIRNCAVMSLKIVTAFMLIGRLISGVHWLTDIIGSVFLSLGLVKLYSFAVGENPK